MTSSPKKSYITSVSEEDDIVISVGAPVHTSASVSTPTSMPASSSASFTSASTDASDPDATSSELPEVDSARSTYDEQLKQTQSYGVEEPMASLASADAEDARDEDVKAFDLKEYVDSLTPEEREEYIHHLRKRARIEEARMQTTTQDLSKKGPFNRMRTAITVVVVGVLIAFIAYYTFTHLS